VSIGRRCPELTLYALRGQRLPAAAGDELYRLQSGQTTSPT
jgi:hypothetical protein